MIEAEVIRSYEEIKERAKAVGLSINTDLNNKFTIPDVPKANGLICLQKLKDLDNFIHGYELGYKSNS